MTEEQREKLTGGGWRKNTSWVMRERLLGRDSGQLRQETLLRNEMR